MNRTELADAMMKGLHTPGVEENRNHYVAVSAEGNACLTCALGSALIGKLDGDFREAEILYDSKCFSEGLGEYDGFSELLDIPVGLAVKIGHKHLNGMPIKQIAAWLKSSEGETASHE